MGPIEKMVQDIIDKKLSEEYPQVQLPAIMKAQVTKATPLADEYEYDTDSSRIFSILKP